MSSKTITKCDSCYKEIDPNIQLIVRCNERHILKQGETIHINNYGLSVDICATCYQKISDYTGIKVLFK